MEKVTQFPKAVSVAEKPKIVHSKGFAMVIPGYSVLTNNLNTLNTLAQHMQVAKQGVSPDRPTP